MIFLNMKNTFHISLLYQNDIDGKRIFSNGKLIGVIGSERHWIFGAESGMIFVSIPPAR